MHSNQSSPDKACASKKREILSGKIFIYFLITFFGLYLINVLLGMLSVRFAIGSSYLGVQGECALLFGAVSCATIFLIHNEPVENLSSDPETDELNEA